MRHHLTPILAALTLAALPAGSGALAQTKVKTETIEVAPVDDGALVEEGAAMEGEEAPPEEAPPEEPAGEETLGEEPAPIQPQVQYDLSLLPPPVARTRAQIMEAAHTGDIERMRVVLEANEMPPIVSFGDATDPIEFWRTAGGDPEGREILAIMIEILESGYVHLDAGTPQEMFVWPYFYALPLETLTPSQEVELYKLITPQDRKGMEEFGAYIFYRLGIGPDGTWHFFVAGD